MIDCLNGVINPTRGKSKIDINPSGHANALDILQVIDLMNGSEEYDVWLTGSIDSECP